MKLQEWALEAIIVTYLSFIWIVSCDAVLASSSDSESSSLALPPAKNLSSFSRQEDSLSSSKTSFPSYSSSSSVSLMSDVSSPSILPSSYIEEVTSSDPLSSKNESQSLPQELFRSFKGYSVVRLTPTSSDQLNFLKQLQSNDSKVSDVCPFILPSFSLILLRVLSLFLLMSCFTS